MNFDKKTNKTKVRKEWNEDDERERGRNNNGWSQSTNESEAKEEVDNSETAAALRIHFKRACNFFAVKSESQCVKTADLSARTVNGKSNTIPKKNKFRIIALLLFYFTRYWLIWQSIANTTFSSPSLSSSPLFSAPIFYRLMDIHSGFLYLPAVLFEKFDTKRSVFAKKRIFLLIFSSLSRSIYSFKKKWVAFVLCNRDQIWNEWVNTVDQT